MWSVAILMTTLSSDTTSRFITGGRRWEAYGIAFAVSRQYVKRLGLERLDGVHRCIRSQLERMGWSCTEPVSSSPGSNP